MRRTILFTASLLVTLMLHAQNWCPPGAEWNYQIQAFEVGGYVIRTYTGDTLLDGWVAQRIHESGQMIQYWSGDTIALDNDRYTSLQDSTLFLWGGFGGADGWDTLHRFDATLGDRWFPPGADSICDDGYAGMLEVVVLDTLSIDGIDLRRWELAYLNSIGDPMWGFEVVERLGPLTGLEILPGGCIIVEYGEVLSCYTDYDISYNDAYWPYGCASVVGIDNSQVIPTGSLSPNPGSDHLILTLPKSIREATFLLFDATGRLLLRETLRNEQRSVNTSGIPGGWYAYRVLDPGGALLSQGKWVKE